MATLGEADMTAPERILHFLTPLKNVSPFDVNMAADAGFDVIVPYTDSTEGGGRAGPGRDLQPRAGERRRTPSCIGGREPMLAST